VLLTGVTVLERIEISLTVKQKEWILPGFEAMLDSMFRRINPLREM
jgi:hypothetical protein